MLPIIPLESVIPLFDSEISKEKNHNTYSRLFLLPKTNQVAKIYYRNENSKEKNLRNLKIICQEINPNLLPELILPTAFIEHNREIVGYLMPFVKGRTLEDAIVDTFAQPQRLLDYLDQIASVIETLPPNIHIGDLHTKNVLINEFDQIQLIDVDGFSVDNGFSLICPILHNELLAENLPTGKYFNPDYTPHISKNTDIYCLIKILFYYLLDGWNPYEFSRDRLQQFFQYLHLKKIPSTTIAMLRQLTTFGNNYIIKSSFLSFCVSWKFLSYDDFITTMNLKQEEQYYEDYISKLIEKKESN